MNSLNEHITVYLALIFGGIGALLGGFGNLPLERGDYIPHIFGRDKSHGNIEDLPTNVGVGRRKCTKDIHEQLLKDLGVFLLELLQTL